MRPEGLYDQARLNMVGEALLIVEFGAVLTPAVNDAVIAFDGFLQETEIAGLLESAPTSCSVALRFDPLEVAPELFRARIGELLDARDWFALSFERERKRWRLPVCYGGAFGPDLAPIAERLALPVDEVIAAHLSTVQRVFMVGFAPGFLYTGMLPEIFQLPRLQTVKAQVPAGSVSVAIGQSVISSTPSPTGWHTIGCTPFFNFDTRRTPPVVIGAGDEIQFYQIAPSEFEKLRSGADLELECLLVKEVK
jgi:KipI family sensor histidine kinase inhibitor